MGKRICPPHIRIVLRMEGVRMINGATWIFAPRSAQSSIPPAPRSEERE